MISLISLPTGILYGEFRNNFELARKSVVKINVTALQYDYKHPWDPPSIQAFSGTGFIIDGKKILTNAHVVSGVNTIRIQRPDQAQEYEAKLAFIAHDCDLAILTLTNEAFFEGAEVLEIGELPEINTPVEVIGFPIGGQRVSITRGIVSRLDLDVYSHSGIDSHLIIQVDAAINPGNSGGPAMENGKVIGVAFQTLLRGQNLGYLIPPLVIRRFLKDIQDGYYDGYNEFGISHDDTSTPSLKNFYKISLYTKEPFTGVFIYDILPGSSAEGILQKEDILLKINGHPISEKGDVYLNGNLINYTELVDNLHFGELIHVEVLRKAKLLQLQFKSKITKIFEFKRTDYENPPSYLLCGGLLFQPLNGNLMKTYGQHWAEIGAWNILYRYNYYTQAHIYKKVSEDVILTNRLSDTMNTYSGSFVHHIVKKVNGKRIKGFAHFYSLIQRAIENYHLKKRKEGSIHEKDAYLVIEFYSKEMPLVFEISELEKAQKRIKNSFNINKDHFLSKPFTEAITSK